MMYAWLWVYLLVATFFLLLQFADIHELGLPLATNPFRSYTAIVLTALLWPWVICVSIGMWLRAIFNGVQ